MKKYLLMFTFLLLSRSLISADYFSELPNEIKELIVSGAMQESDVNAAIKNIQQLRLVNKDFRDIIDNNKLFTRYLIEDILSKKEFPHFRGKKTDNDQIIAALLLGTPAALNYLKDKDWDKYKFYIKMEERFQKKEFKENIDFYKKFAEALLNSGININDPIIENYAHGVALGKDFDFLKLLISKGYDFAKQNRLYFYGIPLKNGCGDYKPLVEFLLKNGVQFNPKILDKYKISMERMEYDDEEELPYCKQIYDLLVNAKENQNPNLP